MVTSTIVQSKERKSMSEKGNLGPAQPLKGGVRQKRFFGSLMGPIPTPLLASEKSLYHVVIGILTVERKCRPPRAVVTVPKRSRSVSFAVG